jgi:predicted ester cyclase
MSSPNTQRAEGAASSYLAVWNGADDAALDSLLDPDFRRVGDPLSESADGVPAVRALVRKMRIDMPDLQVEVLDGIYTPERAAIRWRLSGTDSGPGDFPPTGRHAVAFGLSLMRFRDGRIIEEVTVLDGVSLLTQLGFAITPPSP